MQPPISKFQLSLKPKTSKPHLRFSRKTVTNSAGTNYLSGVDLSVDLLSLRWHDSQAVLRNFFLQGVCSASSSRLALPVYSEKILKNSRNQFVLWTAVFYFTFALALAPALSKAQTASEQTTSTDSTSKAGKRKAKKEKAAAAKAAADAADQTAAADTSSKSSKRKARKEKAAADKAAASGQPATTGAASTATTNTTKTKESEPTSPASTAAPTPSTPRTQTTSATAATHQPPKASAQAASSPEIAEAQSTGKVWVNTETKVYHKSGRWYGKTKHGKFMTESEAKAAGYKEAQRE